VNVVLPACAAKKARVTREGETCRRAGVPEHGAGTRTHNTEARSASLLDRFFSAEQLAEIDPFDHFQLEGVLEVCRQAESLSAAGRRLFAASRRRKKSTNDADRLKEYRARVGLDWQALVKG
jgi:sigma54-dependent transcription regulator